MHNLAGDPVGDFATHLAPQANIAWVRALSVVNSSLTSLRSIAMTFLFASSIFPIGWRCLGGTLSLIIVGMVPAEIKHTK